jgi:hypothetical protein
MVARKWLNCRRSGFGQGGTGLVLQRALGDVHQFGKRSGILRGDVSEDLAVERDFGRFQTFHETAIGQAGFADGGVDANLPEITERAFFGTAIAIRILTAVIDGIRGVAIKFGALEAKAFCGG